MLVNEFHITTLGSTLIFHVGEAFICKAFKGAAVRQSPLADGKLLIMLQIEVSLTPIG
jgi:hypothetical protein